MKVKDGRITWCGNEMSKGIDDGAGMCKRKGMQTHKRCAGIIDKRMLRVSSGEGRGLRRTRGLTCAADALTRSGAVSSESGALRVVGEPEDPGDRRHRLLQAIERKACQWREILELQ